MDGITWGPWLVLLLLGAGHGLNPGMGWLFAVALGLQEGRSAAVWRALGPLAAGHAVAVALAVAVAAALGAVLPLAVMKWLVAALLLGFAAHRLFINRHPRFGGMRVSSGELALWSLFMASAHGAGLMVVPVLLGMEPAGGHSHPGHAPALRAASLLSGPALNGLLATAVHTAGYLLVTGLLAVLVYQKLGLKLLRTAWINLDLIWAGALVVTALVVVWGGPGGKHQDHAAPRRAAAEAPRQVTPPRPSGAVVEAPRTHGAQDHQWRSAPGDVDDATRDAGF